MVGYPSYKHSKIDWLGDIPSHWITMPLRFTAIGNGCTFIDGDWIESKNITSEGIKYLTTGNVGPGFYKEQGSGYITEDTFKELDCTDVFPGDLLISRLNEPIARTCIVPDLDTRIVTAVDNVIYRPNPKICDKRYVCYWLNNAKLTEHANVIARGATMHRISRTMLGHLPILLPPIDEQCAIADYLEAECKKIDDLIAREEKRVSLLHEVRLSILTKAVLQGLNVRVETAPNKHNWLGNIPKHWKIMPLRYTATAKGCCFIDGDWIESKDIDYDGSIKYLTTGNVGSGFYKEQGLGYITEEKFKELDCTDVLPGDLLISRLNEPIARTCIVPDLGSRIVTAVDNVIFRPNPNILDRKFACYYLNNGRLTEHANIIARGATMHRVSRTMLGHLPVVLPPLDEQRHIVAFLDKECNQYDNRIVRANHQIDLLKEYKQSLITEVVTGKRKVC